LSGRAIKLKTPEEEKRESKVRGIFLPAKRITPATIFSLTRIVLCLIFLLFLPPRAQPQESGVEALLSQADVLYIQGNYEKARSLYLEASRLTEKNLYLSRAFFGAALCSFYLGDEAETRNNLERVLAIDPKKEISALFYPQGFWQIFNEMKKKFLSGEINKDELTERREAKEKVTEKDTKPESKPGYTTKEEAVAFKEELIKETSSKPGEGEPSLPRPKRYFLGGHWELEVHYGRWGLNPGLSLFKDSIVKRIGSEVRRELTDYLSSRYGSLVQSNYSQQLSLGVEGWNEGLGLRYYSQGEKGSMSLGFSVERTHLRLKTAGSLRQEFSNGSQAQVEAEAFVRADPVCSHFSFRWDFWPAGRLSPYFVFGLGFGPLKGTMGYAYEGTYSFYGYQEKIKESQEKSFEAWRQEEGSHINLRNIILLQLSLGVKIEVYRGLQLQAEAGIWDGFLLRGGLAFRL